jgi:hypothetical protein
MSTLEDLRSSSVLRVVFLQSTELLVLRRSIDGAGIRGALLGA